ncbi:thioredoxin family protein [Marinobacterium sediminicola]|uniref:Thioredoxin-like fold domain-containing protein n=1 Tax=Marinobacterium sediminicola TaxID=518898 RepID=A0ABY1RVS0_9GAMM|nr:thioredoxin fold domain-containing protein [Marinobacterium sediminicola]ULG70576.1 hypothetical protein LN244_07115 [Marinobacterium sediminicola]SMR68964.1 hypothetical protein SAMN04487964_10176 [Marinobacterium sediminicola]
MKPIAILFFLLLCAPCRASEALSPFTGLAALRESYPANTLLVLMFSQPDCPYCDTVRSDFLLPLHNRQRDELIVRELKVGMGGEVVDQNGNSVSHKTLADRYGVSLFPSVLMLDLDGDVLDKPLVGISSTEFYGYYLDQAIDRALVDASQ